MTGFTFVSTPNSHGLLYLPSIIFQGKESKKMNEVGHTWKFKSYCFSVVENSIFTNKHDERLFFSLCKENLDVKNQKKKPNSSTIKLSILLPIKDTKYG